MPDSSDFAVNLTADVSGFTSGMDEAKNAASEAGEEIKGSLEEGGGAEALSELGEQSKEALEKFTALGEGLKGIAEVMGAGFLGEAINKTVEEFVELGTEVQRTATIMGTSNAEAHAWVDAAELSGVAANSFTQASRAMAAQVLNGGKQLKEMGISLNDTDGAMKTSGQLIEETITKLESYSASADRNALAQKTLGRGWIDLVANGQTLLANLDQQKEEFSNVGSREDQLVGQTKALQAANAQMKISWDEIATSSGPALIVLLKGVAESLAYISYMAKSATAAVQSLFAAASHAGDVVSGLGHMFAGAGSENPLTDPSASSSIKSGWDQITAAVKSAGDEANKFSDIQTKLDDQFNELRTNIWSDKVKQYTDQLKNAGSAPAPPANIPKGGGKGGGGGADNMQGMDNALSKADEQMQTLTKDFDKMGTEAQLASKTSMESFDDLRAKAQTDYATMQEKYKEFQDAVASGSKVAAQQADQAWHKAAEDFKKDWEDAKQKAQQDMQQIKSFADSMSSQVSGVLNNAISGKLNWAQELNKVLSQMLDALIKYVFEMAAYMKMGDTMQQASQAASHGNMIGELLGFFATKHSVETTSNAASVTAQTTAELAKTAAVTSAQAQQLATLASSLAAQLAVQKTAAATQGITDAGVAAANTMAALTPIPIIGPALAAATAPGVFSETMSYAMAEGGFDVPPGVSPMTQLHPREMVLPADIAGGMRRMIAGGGGGGSTSVTQNIHAIDSKSFLDIVDSNHQGIAQAVAKARRGGGRFNMG